MIKLVACLTVLLAINSSPVFAGSKHCPTIKLGSEQQACDDGKAGSTVPKREPGLSDNPKMMDSVEILKLEDDRLAKRLQGICRGC
jgi:hypothetical protein